MKQQNSRCRHHQMCIVEPSHTMMFTTQERNDPELLHLSLLRPCEPLAQRKQLPFCKLHQVTPCALYTGVLNSVNMLARQHGYRRCSVFSKFESSILNPKIRHCQMRASNLKPVLDLRRTYAASRRTAAQRRVGKSVRNSIALCDIS